jgi:hypothetical protein
LAHLNARVAVIADEANLRKAQAEHARESEHDHGERGIQRPAGIASWGLRDGQEAVDVRALRGEIDFLLRDLAGLPHVVFLLAKMMHRLIQNVKRDTVLRMLVLLNSAFDEWARRFDELRAATDCPPMSAIELLCPTDKEAHAAFVLWLSKNGLTESGGTLLMHCHRGRATLRRARLRPTMPNGGTHELIEELLRRARSCRQLARESAEHSDDL